MTLAALAAPFAGLIVLGFAASVSAQAPQPSAPFAAAPPAQPPMSEEMRAQMRATRAACADDIAKLCPYITTRDDRRACMMQKHNQFSETCKSARAAMRQMRQSTRSGGPSGE